MDLIWKIHPALSEEHNFILVTTDYFTKWVETVPLNKAKQKNVIQFIKEQIIYRFRILQSITTDQGTMFIGEEMNYFAVNYGIQLIKSTPFYAQAKGQVERSNKVLKGFLEKMLEENPRDWHRILS